MNGKKSVYSICRTVLSIFDFLLRPPYQLEVNMVHGHIQQPLVTQLVSWFEAPHPSSHSKHYHNAF